MTLFEVLAATVTVHYNRFGGLCTEQYGNIIDALRISVGAEMDCQYRVLSFELADGTVIDRSDLDPWLDAMWGELHTLKLNGDAWAAEWQLLEMADGTYYGEDWRI